ncbi:hypothetical protein RHGRI_021322 [Rhododendron griersonianum]|uniref:Uncharacterized protein n=1 Tax=Rhododendron griersonianum TaxID=479676 RepID=A0AAV6JJS8_9ERIC|nr:hypothetical protein RHGRI_021322 [Rhododendron griersonianum]
MKMQPQSSGQTQFQWFQDDLRVEYRECVSPNSFLLHPLAFVLLQCKGSIHLSKTVTYGYTAAGLGHHGAREWPLEVSLCVASLVFFEMSKVQKQVQALSTLYPSCIIAWIRDGAPTHLIRTWIEKEACWIPNGSISHLLLVLIILLYVI